MDAEDRGRTEQVSLGTLLSNLIRESTSLVRQEVELAKAEVSEKGRQATKGIAAIVTAGAVLYAGFLVLLAAAVFGLNTLLPEDTTPWLSALIVGGIVVIVGFAMLQSGRKKLQAQNLKLERTLASLRNDRDLARQHEQRAKEQV
ncbi:MAG: phage holin family protein [Halomonas sp.]|nr:phage holin family protein [Halomonas sp.]